MVDEQTKPPFNRKALIPNDLDWASLVRLDGDPLETHYRHILSELGKTKGTAGHQRQSTAKVWRKLLAFGFFSTRVPSFRTKVTFTIPAILNSLLMRPAPVVNIGLDEVMLIPKGHAEDFALSVFHPVIDAHSCVLKHRAVLHIGEWDVVEPARVLCFVHDKIMRYNMSIVNCLRIHGMVRGADRSQRVSSVTSRALFD
jgi:hypothetical protein